MAHVSPQLQAAQERHERRERQRGLERRALAARDSDVTPQMRSARALVTSKLRWDALMRLSGRDYLLPLDAEERLDEQHGDVEKALRAAREARL